MDLWTKIVIVILYTASAGLPLLGLGSLYRRSVREADDYAAAGNKSGRVPTYNHVNFLVKYWDETIKSRPASVARDFLYIGLGVVLGAGASVWAFLATT